ncbi:MAG: conjugal transfer protein TraI [Dysgonomonas mossii]|uniref:conjugal transfer protein TraI n=1 Tax=Dysgonomonas mossii TaxID=163665 RepID=UPI0039948BBC
MYRLIILVESRIRRNVYVRFGGEYLETDHSNMIRRWVLSLLEETVKIYKQGKEYYDALKKVKGLVRDARKVQQTILMMGDITDVYVNSFQKMLSDPYFSPEELSAIAQGYTILLQQSSNVLVDLKSVVNESSLSMNDKERMDIINVCYDKVFEYRGLVQYYTNKNIGVSYLRAKKQKDQDRVLALYGKPSDRYW